MKCEVCNKDGLSWLRKLFMALSFPMKCKHCDARYRLNIFYSIFGQVVIGLFYIPIIISNFWLSKYISWQWIVVIDLASWILLAMLIPIQLNPKDPVNAIVQRIQDKKRQVESPDTRSDF